MISPADHMESEDTSTIVPVLSKDVEIYPTEKECFILHQTEYDHRLIINSAVKRIIDLVDGKKNLNNLVDDAFTVYQLKTSEKALKEVFFEDLAKYGIIRSEREVVKKDNADYLKLRFILFPETLVTKVSHVFGFLYSAKSFYLSLVLMLTGILAVLFSVGLSNIYSALTIKTTAYAAIFGFFSSVMHELGHATACRKFGAKHGGIGFGFYVFSPVLYADVSDAWKLSANKRIMVDLAGIYMNVFLGSFLTIAYLITKDLFFLNVSLFIVLSILVNLNPLLRYDGYWALCDLLKIPNLRSQSDKMLGNVRRWVFSKEINPLTESKNILLFSYGLASWCFFMFFISYLIIFNHNAILDYPKELYTFFKTIITTFPAIDFNYIKNALKVLFMPTLFFLIVSKLIYRNSFRLKDLIKF